MTYVSENTTKRKKALDDHEATKPGAYQSQYQDTINGLIDQVVNRKDFKYDFNADPLYHQYKDNYVQQGNQAMMNTMANAATLTGGFGNSYATSAGAQANQQHMSRLNDVIPELYNAAMDKYNMDTDRLVSQYGVATDADNREYNRYADALANWQANRDYLYSQYMDAIGQDQYQEQFDYQKDRDAVADRQWQTQWNYQVQQDVLARQLAEQQETYTGGGGITPANSALNKVAQATQSVINATGNGMNAIIDAFKKKSSGNNTGSSVLPTSYNMKQQIDTLVNIEQKAKSAKSDTQASNVLADAVNKGQISINDADRIYKNIMMSK